MQFFWYGQQWFFVNLNLDERTCQWVASIKSVVWIVLCYTVYLTVIIIVILTTNRLVLNGKSEINGNYYM